MKDTEKLLRQTLKEDPRYAQAYALLGAALYEQGNCAGAVAAYERAIDIDPNNARNEKCIVKMLWK
jgi:cytochrome c-type biogenesis protein CcmH/NrfG